jgi:hypothetical protein
VPLVEIDTLTHGLAGSRPATPFRRAGVGAAIGGHDRWVLDGNHAKHPVAEPAQNGSLKIARRRPIWSVEG